MPRLRAKAVNMVFQGKSVTEVARYFGYAKGTVSKWVRKMPKSGAWIIPTESSRPHSHPQALPEAVVAQIVAYKRKYRRCAEVIHGHLLEDGIQVSLNSVKRKLDQAGLTQKRSPWKRLHLSTERPSVAQPGDLVQVDTIHLMESEQRRIYVYTLIDVYSRWTYAWAVDRISARKSVEFVKRAQALAPFVFQCLQSDHGSEFSQRFTERVKILHRHSRVRRPNDNAHLERFNRTLQDELLRELPVKVRLYNRKLPEYLSYYNTERLHLGIQLKTPLSMIQNCFQAIG